MTGFESFSKDVNNPGRNRKEGKKKKRTKAYLLPRSRIIACHQKQGVFFWECLTAPFFKGNINNNIVRKMVLHQFLNEIMRNQTAQLIVRN